MLRRGATIPRRQQHGATLMIGFIVGLHPLYPGAFRADRVRLVWVENSLQNPDTFSVFVGLGERQSILYFSGTKDACKVEMARLLGAITGTPDNTKKALDLLGVTLPSEYMEREGG